MNKTAIKSFSIWARNKLIADAKYRAGLLGITQDGVSHALPQSTKETEFYDIGTAEPYAVSGETIRQRKSLVEALEQKEKGSDYQTAYKYVIEEVAYTWFNRLIAIRFMEVNDYLPSHVRVLSSESGKMEPDLVTSPFDADLPLSDTEKMQIVNLKNNNEMDECFRMLFIKQCNALNEILPALFEKTSDYSEYLLNISAIDKDGVVYHLVNDIPEDDFDVSKGGQVEIIGWLYQYYNTEPKDAAFAKKGKITKEEIPAVTQLFTPDWIVRYMVENSLGRLWVDGHPNDLLKSEWKYYFEDAEQKSEVKAKLEEIYKEYEKLKPEDIHFIDPCMGSGHILVYAFDVLMQIYESVGYSQRDAAKSIIENNLYGLDIDDRAYQMAYFAVMMKARQYNRRILSADTTCHVYSVMDSNSISRNELTYFGVGLSDSDKKEAIKQITGLLDSFRTAKEYGSILNVENYNWDLIRGFILDLDLDGQMTLDELNLPQTQERILRLIDIGETMARKYEVVVTNPPYMTTSNSDEKLLDYLKSNYKDSKADLFSVFIERCIQFSRMNGFLSLITQQSWMFLSSFEALRHKIYNHILVNMIHLGARAFDEIGGEVVQTSTFVLNRANIDSYNSLFVKVDDVKGESKKRDRVLNILRDREEGRYYVRNADELSVIDGYPLSYWSSDRIIEAFKGDRRLDEIAHPKKGLATTDNNRFLRAWFEVDITKAAFGCANKDVALASKKKWFPLNKGGAFRRWYGNKEYLVNWEHDGREMKETIVERYHGGSYTKEIRSEDRYFSESITWSALTTGLPSFRYSEAGSLFDSAGSSMFPVENKEYILGLLNTKIISEILYIINPTLNYGAGSLAKIPVLIDNIRGVDSIVKENVLYSKKDWNSFELSWDYVKHPLTRGETKGILISDKYEEWETECETRFNQLQENEEKLNRIFIDIYGLQEELTPDVEDKDVTVRKADLQRDIKSLISYAVGCMFGRYSVDKEGLVYAGGDFSEVYGSYTATHGELKGYTYGDLAGKTHGQLAQKFCCLRDSEKDKFDQYPVDIDNIIPITDEEYFEDDIVGLFCRWLKYVYGADTLEQNLDFIAPALGNKGSTSREIIRNYFVNDFFKDHCQTYSVTGSGKRPVYWLFDSGKQNGFKALIYLHRYNADTIGNLRVDYLHRMQRVYESEITRMQDMIEHSTNSREVGAATKRKEKLQKQLKECHDYDEKIGHLALSRTELDLDDGVKVNYRKVQTANDGKFYEVLADSKSIMTKEK